MRTRDALLAVVALGIGCAESLGVDDDSHSISQAGGAGASGGDGGADGAAGERSDAGSNGTGGSYVSSGGAFGDGGSAGNDAGEDGAAGRGVSGTGGQGGSSSPDAATDASPHACDDGAKNGNETDVDCGGSCAPGRTCATGHKCSVHADCTSGACALGVCQATCSDGLENGDETDVDCGGGACAACGANKTCGTASDCVSTVCTPAKVCGPPPSCSSPAGCTCDYFGGRAYAFCTTGKTWALARADCESAGMKLVRADDARENAWVRTTGWQLGLTDSWLGAADVAVEGEWKWSDGVSFWSGSSSGASVGGHYNAWNTNEPNNLLDQDCAHYFGSEKWADDWCGSSRPFVCEDY